MKIYDEKKLKEIRLSINPEYISCSPECIVLPNSPEYIVLPISKIKEWSFRINVVKEHKYRNKHKVCLTKPQYNLDNDYLLIFQNVGDEDDPIYRELITQNDFYSINDRNFDPDYLEDFQIAIYLAQQNPLFIDLSEAIYKLNDYAKIQFGMTTLKKKKQVAKIIQDLIEESKKRLNQNLNIIVDIDYEEAERENALRNTTEFIKTYSKK